MNPTGNPAASSADASAAQMAPEIAKHMADAGQMAQKCDQSKNNESKMPQMPEMKMPENKKEDKPQDYNPYNNGLNPDGDKNTTDSTNTSVQVDKVDFGENKNPGVLGFQPNKPSDLSGHQAAGPTSGAGPAPGAERNNDRFEGSGGNGVGAAIGKVGGGGSSPLNTSGGSKLGNGIAGSEIKPEAPPSYEVSPGTGKSLLGLRGGSSDDESAPLVGAPSKGGGGKEGGADGKPGAGGASMQGGGAGGPEDGLNLFKMIHQRYVRLKELGQI